MYLLKSSFDVTDLCQNPLQQRGICINIRNCSMLLNLLQSSSQDPTVGNFLRSSVCGYEGGDPRVCCPSDTGGGNTDDTENSNDRSRNKEIMNTVYGPLYPPDCGSNNVSLRRIVGGQPASLGKKINKFYVKKSRFNF
jgi:hypothetical protein